MNILDVNVGLVFWTIVNFAVFFFVIMKFGTKPIANALKNREAKINSSIEGAEKANLEAKQLLEQSKVEIANAQSKANEIISSGRGQVEQLLTKANEEASVLKDRKIKEAVQEIEKSKEKAIGELKSQVADLVVLATEKILVEKIDKEKDLQLIDKSISNIENSISKLDEISQN